MDDKLPEILVLNSKCLMAEKFGILFTRVRILAPKNGYAVRALHPRAEPRGFPLNTGNQASATKSPCDGALLFQLSICGLQLNPATLPAASRLR